MLHHLSLSSMSRAHLCTNFCYAFFHLLLLSKVKIILSPKGPMGYHAWYGVHSLFVPHSRAICTVWRDSLFSRPRVLRSQSCFAIMLASVKRTCLRFQLLASCRTRHSILYNSLLSWFHTSASSIVFFDILHLLSKLQSTSSNNVTTIQHPLGFQIPRT